MDGSWNIGSIGFAGPPLRGPSTSRLVAEPPLSPPVSGSSLVASAQPVEPSPTLQPATAPVPQAHDAAAPASEPAPKPAASLESLLMRFRLITSDQLDEALREKAVSGKDIGAIVVERGWVNEDQLARLLSYAPAFPAESAGAPPAAEVAQPAPEPEPEPELEAQPSIEPALETATPAEPYEPEPEPAAEPATAPAMPWPPIPPALELVDEPSSGFAPAPFEMNPEPPAASEPVAELEPEPEPAALAELEPAALAEPEPAALAEPEPAAPAEPEPAAEPDPEPFAEPVLPLATVEVPAEAELLVAEPEATTEPVAAEPMPEPEPQVDSEPQAELEPAPEPEPETATEHQVVHFVEPASIETIARVFVRLSNGERVEAGSFDDMAAAKARAEEVVAELSNGANGWPFFAGRYIRPEAVVSVDLDATVVRYA